MDVPEFRPRQARLADPSALREVMCRSCARWMTFDRERLSDPSGSWAHQEDGTPACLPPVSLA